MTSEEKEWKKKKVGSVLSSGQTRHGTLGEKEKISVSATVKNGLQHGRS